MTTISISTPALLFSAISLIMLAQTNRFLSYAQLVRNLQKEHEVNPTKITKGQIKNLRTRLYLTRSMQVTGISSLLLCVVSMLCIYTGFVSLGSWTFVIALVLMITSLSTSIYEIYISVRALELNLNILRENETKRNQ